MELLEDKLVKTHLLTRAQYNLAKEEAYKCQKSFWSALVKLGFLSEDDLCVFFAQESGSPYARISDYQINPQVLSLIAEDFCRQNLVIPLFKIQNTLFVACANPLDSALIDNLAKINNCEVEPLISPQTAIIKALDYYYGQEDKVFAAAALINRQPPVEGLPFWRESERLALNIPVSITVEDISLVSPATQPIESYARDISRNGTALGLEILLFLPKGAKIALEFRPPAPVTPIKTRGEIVYCRMEKNKRYFLGIRFSEISPDAQAQLFQLAAK